MENNLLNIYGPPIIEYNGTGKILLEDATIIEGEFKCIQLHNTEIYIEMSDCTPLKAARIQSNDFLQVRSFEGKLADGRDIKIDDKISHISYSEKTQGSGLTSVQLLLQAENFELNSPVTNSNQIGSVTFTLTNFTFPPHFTGLNHTLTNTKLTYEVNGVRNYRTVEARMAATRVSTVTAYLQIEPDGRNLSQLIEVADNLCSLFTFANGTRINWIAYEVFDLSGGKVFTYHKSNTITNYTRGLEVIGSLPGDLLDFIDATYDNFILNKTDYRLTEIINALAQSKSGGLPVIAALNASGVIEALRATWADKNNRSFIFMQSFFTLQVNKPIEVFTKPLLKSLKSSKVQRNDVYQKIGELNRPTFQTVLKEMVICLNADIGIGTNPKGRMDEVKKFVTERDLLVHQGKFSSANDIDELYQILSIADRLILALLDYKSPYYDYRSETLVIPKRSEEKIEDEAEDTI